LLIDLHCHSYPKSDDSFMSVDELIEGAKASGIDGVCLTEHDAFWSGDEVRELSTRHGFLVLAGSEINTDTGHTLVFGLDQYEFGMHRPEFLSERVARRGGAIIAAHPYRRRFLPGPAERPGARDEMLERARNDGLFRVCQAIEGLNGRGTEAQNRFSLDLGDRLHTGITAGSDAHRVEQLGTTATEFPSRIESMDDLIFHLRSGNYRPVDLRTPAGPGNACNS
jgi:sugar phosphate isomerase/epimerase